MKLCRATQLHMLALVIVSHIDMKLCRIIIFYNQYYENVSHVSF